ncbi:hypothetical protein F5X96DRAFT_671862 [Biscogniauxia mediterranea]|nr:hypothetical protein F5X96DRAFT_671862 [Biscogniauxia mediterranea]
MEQISCSCVKCNQCLSQFPNLWTKIGKGYISPIVQAEGPLNIVASSEIRLGETQTLVDGCVLVGLECIDTPVNHVLRTGQLLLRISSILITTVNGNTTVAATIQRTLKLRESSSDRISTNTSIATDEVDLAYLLTALDTQRENIQKLDSASHQIVATFNRSVSRIDADVQKLRDEMTELQKSLGKDHAKTAGLEDDIKWLSADLAEVRGIAQDMTSSYKLLENEVSATKQNIASLRLTLDNMLSNAATEQHRNHDTVGHDWENVRCDLAGLRKELDEARSAAKESISISKTYARELVPLKAEINHLKEELTRERSQNSLSNNSLLPSHEIDILTSNITKIGQRASQVETLQMEFDLLKGRIQRMEACDHQKDSKVDAHNMEPSKYRPESLRRKRSPSPRFDEPTGSDVSSMISPNKRPSLHTWSSSPTRNYDYNSSPLLTRAPKREAKPPRLTKAGVVDRRTMRRGPKGSVTDDRTSNG